MSAHTISRQFDSDERAQNVFKATLEGHFLIREYNKPDFFLDYHIEERCNGEPTANRAFVQLKGQLKFRRSGGFGRVQMASKHLRYYANAEKEPVFLVLADGEKREAYYLFMQGWLEAANLGPALQGKKRITVSVPLANDLSVIPKFLSDFRAARHHMKEKHPGSPEAALANSVAGIAKLDERFEVKAFLTPMGKKILVTPKTPVNVKLHLIHEHMGQLQSNLESVIGFGTPIALTNVRAITEGSALFAKIFDESKSFNLALSPKHEIKCLLAFSGKSGSRGPTFSVPAKMRAGLIGVSLEISDEGCPLKFTSEIRASDIAAKQASSAKISFDFEVWGGKPLRSLPWFDILEHFVRITHEQSGFRFSIIHEGKQMLGGTIGNDDGGLTETFGSIASRLGLLKKARELANVLGINPTTPAGMDISGDEWREIAEAYTVHSTGKVEASSICTAISTDERDGAAALVKDIQTSGESVGLARLQVPATLRLFDCESSLGYLEAYETQVRWVQMGDRTLVDREVIEVKATPADGGPFSFTLIRKP